MHSQSIDSLVYNLDKLAEYESKDDYKNALILAERMYKKSPKHGILYGILGGYNLMLKNINEAEIYFLKAIKYDPDDVISYYNLACVQIERNNLDQSFTYLDSAFLKGYGQFDDEEYEWLSKDPDIKKIESDKRYELLMTKYFSDKDKKVEKLIIKSDEAFDKERYKKALSFINKAEKLEKESPYVSPYTLGVIYDYKKALFGFHQLNNLNKFLEYSNEAIKYFTEIGKTSQVAKVHEAIGLNYKGYENKEKFLYHYNKAFKIWEKHNNNQNLANNRYDILFYQFSPLNNTFIKNNDYFDYFEELMFYANLIKRESDYIDEINIGAEKYRQISNYSKSLKLSTLAFNLSEHKSYNKGLIISTHIMASTYLSLGLHDQANYYFNYSLKINRSTNNISDFLMDYWVAVIYKLHNYMLGDMVSDSTLIDLMYDWEYPYSHKDEFESQLNLTNINPGLETMKDIPLNMVNAANLIYELAVLSYNSEDSTFSNFELAFDKLSRKQIKGLKKYFGIDYNPKNPELSEYPSDPDPFQWLFKGIDSPKLYSTWDVDNIACDDAKNYSTALNLLYTSLYSGGSVKPEIINKTKFLITKTQECEILSSTFKLLQTLAKYYSDQNLFIEAGSTYQELLVIIDQIRLQSPNDYKKNYFEQHLDIFSDLSSLYIKNDQPQFLLESLERRRVKNVVERLGPSNQYTNEMYSLDDFIESLGEDEVVLYYSIIGDFYNNYGFENYYLISLSHDSINVTTISGTLISKLALETGIVHPDSRDIKKLARVSGIKHDVPNISSAINFYKFYLKNNMPEAEQLSKILYEVLLSPIENDFKTKTKITIIPDLHLSTLPFETLINDRGVYFGEDKDIKYGHSIVVLNDLKKRTYNTTNNKSILAFGGAVYSEDIYHDSMQATRNNDLLTEFDKATLLRGENALNSSDILSYEYLPNLPGSYKEVTDLAAIFDMPNIITGEFVTEDEVKRLASSGEISDYKILHFATHGMIVNDFPQLSALIFSKPQKGKSTEDGFLTVSEIANMKIQVDFVNLSACMTGMGEVTISEGIIGLSQAFIIAGANSVSASLWEVPDESTAIFMSEMYQKVNDGNPFSQAIALTKREFINGAYGEKYKAPYYWAPFVYYGN